MRGYLGAAVGGIVLGLLAGALVFGHDHETRRHWRAVEDYLAHMRDPSNYAPDGRGLRATTPPIRCIEYHLMGLVAADELRFADIVLPTVPVSNTAAKRQWMAFCDSHSGDIIYATGNAQYASLPISGEQPLHLQIWYRPGAEGKVKQLIDELEAFAD